MHNRTLSLIWIGSALFCNTLLAGNNLHQDSTPNGSGVALPIQSKSIPVALMESPSAGLAVPAEGISEGSLTSLTANSAFGIDSTEDWLGYQGGGPRRNASLTTVDPELLGVAWIRRFNRQVASDDLSTPVPEKSIVLWGTVKGAFGSRNLVVADGRVAIIAADHQASIPVKSTDTAWVSLLDHSTGQTVNCIQVAVNPGKAGVWSWPRTPWTDASDQIWGQVAMEWDQQSGALFLSVGGDSARYTAYHPTANLSTYITGQFQAGIPAFQSILEEHPLLQDAFGRPRNTIFNPYTPNTTPITPPLPNEAAHWGPSLTPLDDAGKYSWVDTNLPILGPFSSFSGAFQNNVQNRTMFITIDREGPGIAMGHGYHHDCLSYYMANKWNGMYSLPNPIPPLELTDESGVLRNYPQARPFSKWGGMLIHRNRLYAMSPGTDDDNSGQLGIGGGTGYANQRLDQGLGLWAYQLNWTDQKPNDGAAGEAANESVYPTQLWGWSRKTTVINPLKGESHEEVDGLYRNKSMLVDGEESLWAIWTRSTAEGIELVKANQAGQQGWLLGIGRGLPGSERWPHLALAEHGSNRWLVAYIGNAWHRSRGPYTLPDLNTDGHLGLYTSGPNVGKPIPMTGNPQLSTPGLVAPLAFSAQNQPPLGPAELAVFDANQSVVTQRIDFSQIANDLQPNEFYGFVDRSHLVVTGHMAYVGWVGTAGPGDAELVLCGVDLEKPHHPPVIRRFPLGFSAADNQATALIDLVAADGQIYALIYRSNVLSYFDQRWSEQIVVALSTTETPTYLQWRSAIQWQGADSSELGDPDRDGKSNQMEFLLGHDPLLGDVTYDRLFLQIDDQGNRSLVIDFKQRRWAAGVAAQVSSDLLSWSNLEEDDATFFRETMTSDPRWNSTVDEIRLRLKLAPTLDRQFVRLINQPEKTVEIPTFNPMGGSYTSYQTVAIETATSGAAIKYTTDGSDPITSGSALVYNEPITITDDTVLNAYAFKLGMIKSPTATASYLVDIPIPVALMLDFGTTIPDNSQTNSPYHTSFSLFTDTTWNVIGTQDVNAGLLYSNSVLADGVTLNLGVSSTNIINLSTQPANSSALGTTVNTGVYSGNSVGKDGIWSSHPSLGLQIGGLAAGTYNVYVTARNTNSGNGLQYTQTVFAGSSQIAGNYDYTLPSYDSASLSYEYSTDHFTNTWIEGNNYLVLSVTLVSGEYLNIVVKGGGSESRGFFNSVQIVPVL